MDALEFGRRDRGPMRILVVHDMSERDGRRPRIDHDRRRFPLHHARDQRAGLVARQVDRPGAVVGRPALDGQLVAAAV
ncbi:MAG: hypothetical protein ACJ8G1_14655, partial [Vitreoscilla sp.]